MIRDQFDARCGLDFMSPWSHAFGLSYQALSFVRPPRKILKWYRILAIWYSKQARDINEARAVEIDSTRKKLKRMVGLRTLVGGFFWYQESRIHFQRRILETF